MFNRIIDNPIVQNVAPYLGGAALGGAGQQLMNWVTPGADPNPLLSAALYAPTGAAYLKGRAPENPYAQAAYYGSLAGGLGGAGTSIYNVVAGGDDIDNNMVSAGLGTLGTIAPLTAYLLNRGKFTEKGANYRPSNSPVDDGSFRPFMEVKPNASNYYETNAAYPYNQGTVPSPFRKPF